MKQNDKQLGDIVQPRRKKVAPHEFPNLPYIGLEHVEAHTSRLIGSSSAMEMKSAANQFFPGDVLYSRLRPYLNKVWRADREGLCSSEFIVLPGNEAVDADFLRYRLNSSDFVSFANSLNAGDRPRVDFEQISKFKTWLPSSLGQQRRIVAEIEKQFTRLDAGVAALRRVEVNLKRYRAAVLKAACEGRLVPTEADFARKEGRAFQTGEQLLQRILANRRENWIARGKYKEAIPPEESAVSTQTPDGWTIASVDQLSVHITSGSRDWSRYYGRGSGTFILAQNVRPMRLDMSERQAVDAPKGDAETERTLVRHDDLLVTIVGAKTGDVCRVSVQLKEHYVCQSVALVRPALPETARLLELWLASQENGQAIWKKFIYGQGRPHLGFDQIKATPVLLPPLAEQKRIVAEVERHLSVIAEAETVVTANLARATRLRQAILNEAFKTPISSSS